MELHALFSDHRQYERQIARLYEKNKCRARALEQDGVALASLFLHREQVARLLAAEVGSGTYQFQPARLRSLTVGKKLRQMYVFCLTDRIVHSVVGTIVSQASAGVLSPNLYSYIKGRSWTSAVRAFARYVREHRKRLPDPRTRGLFVLRRDVLDYTNSIPVDDSSRLFALLRQVLSLPPELDSPTARSWDLVKNVVRPVLCAEAEPAGKRNDRGVPTGSPICPVVYNLYLTSMDHELTAVPGGFYARYCDDILFAHADPAVARDVERRIDATLASLGLETKKEKNLDFYFNGAGKGSPAWPAAQGTGAVPFLGCVVSFKGTIALPPVKVRRLLCDLRSRARRTLRGLRQSGIEQPGALLCAALNQALDPRSPLQHRSARFLRREATDRQQLRRLDYDIARLVAQTFTRAAGVRAFRQLSYRQMRTEWKLMSLCQARNRKR
jgi:retron-type reverse transcriptase